MNTDLWAQIRDDLDDFAPPAVALQVLRAVRAPDCQVSELADLIEHDPVLKARMQATANSSFYAARYRSRSSTDAFRVLGLSGLRSLALGFAFSELRLRMARQHQLGEFWKSSITGAIVAHKLAERTGSVPVEDALIGGLLRDLGMAAFHRAEPDRYAQLLAQPLSRLGDQRCAREEQLFAVDHAQVSAYILDQWGLPDDLCRPIEYHHRPDDLRGSSEKRRLAQVLEFADRVVQFQSADCPRELVNDLIELSRDRFGLTLRQFAEFLSPLDRSVGEFSALLAVDVGSDGPVRSDLGDVARAVRRPGRASDHALRAAEAGKARATMQMPRNSTLMLREALSVHGNASPGVVQALTGHPRFELVSPIDEETPPGLHRFRVLLKEQDDREAVLTLIDPSAAGVDDTPLREDLLIATELTHSSAASPLEAERLGEHLYTLTEAVEGVPLDRFVAENGPADTIRACRLIRQAAGALQEAHDLGLIHGQVTARNLVVGPRSKLTVTNFGLSALAGDPDVTTDLRGLGEVFFRLLTGRDPAWSGDEMPSISALRPDVSEKLSLVVQRLLTDDPARRYPTAGSVASELSPFVNTTQFAISITRDVVPEPEFEDEPEPMSVPATEARGAETPAWVWITTAVGLGLVAALSGFALTS